MIICTYHISLYNSSSKKTWGIVLPIHNYLISDIIQGKTFVPITILDNLLAMFVLWSISFIILCGMDMKVPPFHNSTLYGFYLVSSLNYKQQYVSINTSRSIAFCNCASIIIILKRSFHNIFFTCRATQHKVISFSDVCVINNVEMLHNIINKPWVNLLYDHIYYIKCIACVHCSYIERQLYVYNNEKTVHVHFITLTLSQHQISRIHKSMRNIRYNHSPLKLPAL